MKTDMYRRAHERLAGLIGRLAQGLPGRHRRSTPTVRTIGRPAPLPPLLAPADSEVREFARRICRRERPFVQAEAEAALLRLHDRVLRQDTPADLSLAAVPAQPDRCASAAELELDAALWWLHVQGGAAVEAESRR